MSSVKDVMNLIDALRAENGCPWDRKQTPLTLSVYLIEEAFELVEAIAADDGPAIQEELGDVIFQILFLAFLYQQQGRLDLEGVLKQNITKMVRRHPHVFGKDKVDNADQVKQRWREIKRQEKNGAVSLMDSVPSGLPALLRAYRISERAAGAGFDWDDLDGVIQQAENEWAEFKSEISGPENSSPGPHSAAALEFGDVLFSLVNVARVAGFHPETALQRATVKFSNRFKAMEAAAIRQNQNFADLSRDAKERLWEEAKSLES
jgi:MazG family protein